MLPEFSDSQTGLPVHVIEAAALDDWVAEQSETTKTWISAAEFRAKLGTRLLVPSDKGTLAAVLVGWGDVAARRRGRFHLASVVPGLPAGDYRLASGLSDAALEEAALGWLLACYRFDRYKPKPPVLARLVAPKQIEAARIQAIAAGVCLARDLINTPASDMGPDALEAAFRDLAGGFGGQVSVTSGEDLLSGNLPMVHAVGRASDQAPRLLDMRWGAANAPKVTLVGKGVCFDTGGLNIKPGASMGLMKKDMGGAATVMGLARMIMALELPVRLRVLVPAVENSISAGAFRPQDILASRKGLTVEINNTDAEGRLVLADALALADEEKPGVLISMATLTGAARVAVGPDLVPFYSGDDDLSTALMQSAAAVADPLWPMPFWEPYEAMIEPGIADLDNAPKGGFAGSITAALFLRRFVTETASFTHFDVFGWTPKALPARPMGGECQAARAVLDVLERRYR